MDHGIKLSNVAKIYTDNVKYSGRNNNFILNLVTFHDIRSRADVLFKQKERHSFIYRKKSFQTTIIQK